jgi:hypothetical protein
MPPSKPRLTPSGLLAEPFGRRPHTVTLREEREPGANVVLDYLTAEGARSKATLGYPVRSVQGKRSAWDWDALEAARQAAEDRAASLRLGQLRKENDDTKLTVAQAFALYHDPDRGGVRGAMSTIYSHRIARREWERWLGPNTAWNAVKGADIEGLLLKFKDRDMTPSAINLLQKFRACYNWLRKKRGMKHLNDPSESIEMRDIMAGHRAKRPRYTPEEARRIVAVRDEVDPRFALMVALIDDSGARRESLRRTWRSDVNAPLEFDPGEAAPHGWILLPALKQQERTLAFLTSFQRREIDRALAGYLRELERAYQEIGLDYPLFPSARVDTATAGVVRAYAQRGEDGVWRPAQKAAYRPISHTRTWDWLLDAERKAKPPVPHIPGRAWHGLRRAASDYLEESTDLATLTTAMGWSSQAVPEKIYLDKGRMNKRARAREAMEKKRSQDTDS